MALRAFFGGMACQTLACQLPLQNSAATHVEILLSVQSTLPDGQHPPQGQHTFTWCRRLAAKGYTELGPLLLCHLLLLPAFQLLAPPVLVLLVHLLGFQQHLGIANGLVGPEKFDPTFLEIQWTLIKDGGLLHVGSYLLPGPFQEWDRPDRWKPQGLPGAEPESVVKERGESQT